MRAAIGSHRETRGPSDSARTRQRPHAPLGYLFGRDAHRASTDAVRGARDHELAAMAAAGMVNEDDVLGTRRVGPPPGDAVAAVMSAPAVSVGPLVPRQEALHLMVDRRIGALPVVQDGRVIGILTQSDVVATLARHHDEPLAEGR